MSGEKWYHSTGNDGDVVVSTRIRLARNLKEYPFPSRMTKEQLNCVNMAVKDAVKDDSDLEYIEMSSLDRAKRLAMAERHLISPEFAERPDGYAIVLSRDESVCIMICEEDHLRIQVMAAGLDLKGAYEKADRLDTELDGKLHFAFDESLGFLTECPTNLGTGMRASVMLHLPALEAANGIEPLVRAVGKLGLTLRGTFGEGSKAAGALYQLSNQITLGIDEKAAIENLAAIASQVIEKEKEARKTLDVRMVEDRVYRSLGILKNARILDSTEMLGHISNLRLGVSMGLISEVSIEALNTITNDLQAAGIITAHPEAADVSERDRIRAEEVRKILG